MKSYDVIVGAIRARGKFPRCHVIAIKRIARSSLPIWMAKLRWCSQLFRMAVIVL